MLLASLRLDSLKYNGSNLLTCDNLLGFARAAEHKLDELVQRSSTNVPMSQEKMETILYNVMYRFIASSPEFNPVDGTGK